MRSAWNERVAGSMPERSCGTAARMIAASCPVVVIGAAARAVTTARAMRRGQAFLAESEQRVGQFVFRQGCDQVGGGGAAGAHPHIEGAVVTEREAAGGIFDLEGRHAEVEHDAIERGNAVRGEQREHVAEPALDQMEAAGVAGCEGRAAGDGRRVAVDGEHGAGRSAEDGRAVAATAERAVEVCGAGPRGEDGNDLVQHDGDVARNAAGSRHCTILVPGMA